MYWSPIICFGQNEVFLNNKIFPKKKLSLQPKQIIGYHKIQSHYQRFQKWVDVEAIKAQNALLENIWSHCTLSLNVQRSTWWHENLWFLQLQSNSYSSGSGIIVIFTIAMHCCTVHTRVSSRFFVWAGHEILYSLL